LHYFAYYDSYFWHIMHILRIGLQRSLIYLNYCFAYDYAYYLTYSALCLKYYLTYSAYDLAYCYAYLFAYLFAYEFYTSAFIHTLNLVHTTAYCTFVFAKKGTKVHFKSPTAE
jgi:hypothetical protein